MLPFKRLIGFSPSVCRGVMLVLILLCSGCATQQYWQEVNADQQAHLASSTGASDLALFRQHAPIVVTGNAAKAYDRLGKVAARRDAQGEEELYIDPGKAVYYVQRQDFTTPRGPYTNLIYRVHFPEVPFQWIPFHLTAGNNGGLFIILTLNTDGQAVLITTVHTCGCYLAFVPTSYLPDLALPADWHGETQQVYGETLPRRLNYPPGTEAERLRPVLYLNSGTHRVRDIRLQTDSDIAATHATVDTAILPMDTLLTTPLADGYTSFYHTQGSDQGYVKNANKPFEFLLMSWWALDANIGVDKRLGDPDQTGTVFYTSLKPWNRQASNLWYFGDFLNFWGWRL